ncbi:MAG TPA: xanthine dehydrogenase family protein subunit M [Anaerolineales bacterium]|nr:xanthine dehydrogenase family protein subunit M [Anaerolineales bacterium]
MKPAPFEYISPTTVDEALLHLAEYGYEAKVLAGGQSLIPMMNFRLARPAVIIDINKIKELFYIRENQEDGDLRIGAMSRHSQVEHNSLVADRAPLISEAMRHIATVQVRSRGTFGGSIAHADPAAELTAVSVALEGNFLLRSQRGERWVPAQEFFVGLFTSVLEPDEMLIEARFPSLAERTGCALVEVARRPHDFALVGVTATVTLNEDGRCQQAHLVLFSVGDGPVAAHQAVEVLKGKELTPESLRAAAEIAAKQDIDPSSDIHASAEYRRHLAGVLSYRALEKANRRARGDG